ncbi:EcsC family protein [Heliobacterium undosum]|uniref:EcsC family protein n=1 Tax=Heliomicrobium undosum TaxID=121734 RepID=A0A845L5L7_9FIRM|nr:EcsC family protein [Heliomicrobium undosum]MZP30519.1 EcsC family protein [Heliomicrobium undosum]
MNERTEKTLQDEYTSRVVESLIRWDNEMRDTRAGFFDKMTRKLQQKVDDLIPESIHKAITVALETVVKGFLAGIALLPASTEPRPGALAQMDDEAQRIIDRYKKIAAIEGAGTGMGGAVLAAVDFPALITIKLKMLQEIAWLYGYDARTPQERNYLVHVFLLAFASGDVQREIYETVRRWDRLPVTSLRPESSQFDWRRFYKEYRDGIDTRKLLGFLPVVGAPVNAWANYSLAGDLGETAQKAFQLRFLQPMVKELQRD